MKKSKTWISIALCLCMLLVGCGQAAPTVGEAKNASPEVATSESATTEDMSQSVEEESVEETDTAEAETTEESTEDSTEETTEETTTEEETTEEFKTEVTEEITVFDEKKTMYAVTAVNVRFGPSTEYEVVGHLSGGSAVEVTGQADTGWYQVNIGETAYVSNKYLSDTKPEPPAPAQPAQTAPGQPAAVAPAGVIMVGDSRCVEMQTAVGGGGCSWICENGKGYKWFVETAIPRFDQYVGRGTKVVICLGVNDPGNANNYVAMVNAKAAEWAQRGATTYYVSVNPVWENPYTTQQQVDTFNQTVAPSLSGVRWIDTHSWLVTNGYRLRDGLHYDDPTYVNIFNVIMGSL